MNNEEWIGITEAAMILGVFYPKARNLVISGQLGEVQREENGRYFVKRSEVEHFKQENP